MSARFGFGGLGFTTNMGDAMGGFLDEVRPMAEDLMRGTCIVTRSGEPVEDENWNVVTPQVVVYPDPDWPDDHPYLHGPCAVRYPGLAHEQNRNSAGVTVVQSRVVVSVPFGVQFRPGDTVTITSDLDTPQLAGTRVRVASIDDQSKATRQRLLGEDNQAGVGTDE